MIALQQNIHAHSLFYQPISFHSLDRVVEPCCRQREFTPGDPPGHRCPILVCRCRCYSDFSAALLRGADGCTFETPGALSHPAWLMGSASFISIYHLKRQMKRYSKENWTSIPLPFQTQNKRFELHDGHENSSRNVALITPPSHLHRRAKSVIVWTSLTRTRLLQSTLSTATRTPCSASSPTCASTAHPRPHPRLKLKSVLPSSTSGTAPSIWNSAHPPPYWSPRGTLPVPPNSRAALGPWRGSTKKGIQRICDWWTSRAQHGRTTRGANLRLPAGWYGARACWMRLWSAE